MPPLLRAPEVIRYEERGFHCPVPALSPEEAQGYLAAYTALEARLGDGRPPAALLQLHLHLRWAYDLATHPRVLDAVESVLGPDILVWTSQIFPKRPRDPSYVSWHQDGTYWALDSTRVTTAWIALTDSRPDNGCVRVVAGSHRARILPHNETYAPDNLLSRGQEVAVDVAEEDATDLVLDAGELSLHHVNIIHGSQPNRSDRPRVGFAIRYITPATLQEGERPTVILARGEDRHGHYPHLPAPPPSEPNDEALRAQAESARRLRSAQLAAKPRAS